MREATRTKLEEKIRLVQALGELGPDAAPAVPFLLSNSFFYEQGGRTAKKHPLRLATIDALVKIGEPAVPEVVTLQPQVADIRPRIQLVQHAVPPRAAMALHRDSGCFVTNAFANIYLL